MADTIRTKAACLALLPDNTAGDISPQDLRDTVVSLFGVYGCLYTKDGSTAQTGVGTTPAKFTGFASDGAANGTTVSNANDKITISSGSDGTFLVFFHCSFSGTANTKFTFALRKNGAEGNFLYERKLGATGDVGDAVLFGPVESVVATDYFEIYVEADGASKSITPAQSTFMVLRIS